MELISIIVIYFIVKIFSTWTTNAMYANYTRKNIYNLMGQIDRGKMAEDAGISPMQMRRNIASGKYNKDK